jgi:uncharacterized protein
MDQLLDPVEVRVLGSLIEKEITTPEYFPLSLNALTNACNQKTNREPVVSFDEQTVLRALDSLREKRFARMVTGGESRVPKYRQVFSVELNLNAREVAVLDVLMLRGPQTVGELRERGGRLFEFESMEEVENTLERLIDRDVPYVVRLPRQSGQKEPRYAHLLSGEVAQETVPVRTEVSRGESQADRISNLESQIDSLREEITALREEFRQFQKQFD